MAKSWQVFLIVSVFWASSQPAEINQKPTWSVHFASEKVQLSMDKILGEELTISGIEPSFKDYSFHVKSENSKIASVDPEKIIHYFEVDQLTGKWRGLFNISANFLGNTKCFVELVKNNNETERSAEENDLEVIVTREVRVIDHVFTGSVALLVSLLYINFGAALDLSALKGILVRPIGPAIAFVAQFIFMPLLSFGLGYALFPNFPELHLGLFFTGVSPAGGASNIWSVILGGNINLSIVMTTISNLAAFGMMPLWIFTLGHVIFARADLGVPYANIAGYLAALVVPLLIGVGIQKWSPRVTRVLVRLLKPISSMLILFIIIFAIVANLYLFELFSWRIILAGLGLPWLGYAISWTVAKLFKQPSKDALTIALEAGIQNTGIAIFLLRFSLPQPQADLTTVIPVSVAIMTPVPLLFLYIYQKVVARRRKNDERSPIVSSNILSRTESN